jgi:alkylhydroperoxidase family enzyme
MSGAAKIVDMRLTGWRRPLCLSAILAAALCFGGCQRFHHADTQPLSQSGFWSDTIQKLRDLNVSDSEVADLIKLRNAGVSDDDCVEFVKLARGRQQMFTSADKVAGLLNSGLSETTVMELARLNQIETWALEAQSIRLAGYSDRVVLAAAHRRAEHQPMASAPSLVELKNTGVSEQQVLEMISRGLTDEQVGQMLAAHKQTEMPTPFVHRAPAHKKKH